MTKMKFLSPLGCLKNIEKNIEILSVFGYYYKIGRIPFGTELYGAVTSKLANLSNNNGHLFARVIVLDSAQPCIEHKQVSDGVSCNNT
ncbi:MAG: hypothetical protein BAJATHORv1_60050 [Candidatus Thorarchaeota archaeon]|nr:MAG: hypothetical protein BAJATHORv1_60050 [Candidatus Thorarchaeota archaeon]